MQTNILFNSSAVPLVLKHLKRIPQKILPINKGRYAIIKDIEGNRFAVLLKTEPFFNFGRQFQKEGQKGVGDSINCEHLKDMMSFGVTEIFTMFRDGKMYRIDMMTLLSKSFRWKQKEGTEVRSFSIHEYERINT